MHSNLIIKALLLLSFIAMAHSSLAQKKEEDYARKADGLGLIGNYKEAILYFDSALAINRSSWLAYFSRGVAKAMLKDYYGSIADYTESIKLNSKNVLTYHNRGISEYYVKQYDDAIADFTMALDLLPKDTISYLFRGYCYAEWKF